MFASALHRAFAPADALMARLTYARKFVLIGIVLLAPAAIALHAYWSQQGGQIAFSAKERVGVALLLFGMEWLRKGVLRLAGRRARSDSYAEFLAEREALTEVAPPAPGRFDWPGAVIAFKGVLLEGVEVILIVTILGARPGGLAPTVAGSVAAVALVIGLGVVLHRPLRKLPESELKYVVGLVLTTFGTFFCAEGLGADWPFGDGGLLIVLAVWPGVSQAAGRWLAGSESGSGSEDRRRAASELAA